jgi:FlaA1/EpsC-like NDP-sugar epimerase
MKDPIRNDRLATAGQLVLSLILDIAIVLIAYTIALSLKFDGEVPGESWRTLVWAGPLIGFAYILSYQALGVYRTAWQYGSLRDAVMLAVGVAVVTLAILIVQVMLPKRPIPLTANVISAAFILLGHGMVRMLPRMWGTSAGAASDEPKQRVLIVGAGDTGQMLGWDLRHNRSQPYSAVAYVDDDPALRGKRVHGIPVVGGRYDIPDVIAKHGIGLVAIALPPERAPGLQEVLALIEPAKVPVRLVPSLGEVMEGRAAHGEMREITIEDLLAREPMDVDEEACGAIIGGHVVLITGAAGSIGAELTRRVFEYGPSAMHLVDVNETALHELRVEMNLQSAGNVPIKPWLCNISDRQKLEAIFEASRPQVVFHLGAYKHIGMMEENPDQAFETNVLGTLNVFEAAQAVEADEVVFLSSHTAVEPVSIYGASKRIGELLVTSMPQGKTKFCAVRLTNVIDTRGTVLAAFNRQIQRGGPISVTDPEVARYFLTISEVASLVIQAAALASGRDIFLLDTGEELRIADLAERMIRSRGMEPGKDIEIIYTGLRPGEKLSEALTGKYETQQQTSHDRVIAAVSDRTFAGAELRAAIRELEVDLRKRPGNLPARIHALARFDAVDEQGTGNREQGPTSLPQVETRQEP